MTIYSISDFDSDGMKHFKIRGTFTGEDSSLQPQSATTEIKLNLKIDRKIDVGVQSPKIESQENIEFYSTVSDFESVYFIGISNKPISLKSLYVLSYPQMINSVVAYQIAGNLPEDSYSVKGSTLDFIVDLSDKQFGGSSSKFNFFAYSSNFQVNTNLTLTMSFVVATEEQIAASNTPPFFKMVPQTPNPIPCLNLNSALQWKYETPKAFDTQNDIVSYKLTCDRIDDNFFIQTFENQTLSLNLNQDYQGVRPANSSFICLLFLTDQRGAAQKYKITFGILCTQSSIYLPIGTEGLSTQTEKSEKESKKTEVPIPIIKSIDQSGQIVVNWSIPLIIQQNNTQSGDQVNECYKRIPIEVQVVPGQMLQSIEDLAFTYTVNKLGQTQTVLQVTFKNPGLVSIQKTPDQIFLSFRNPNCFTSEAKGLAVDKKTYLVKSIPRQKTGSILEMPSFLTTLVKVVTTISSVAVVSNNVFQGFLSSLLSIVSSLGVVLHMFLVRLNYPVELMNFFSIMFPLITFDAIPVANLYEKWFHFQEIETDHALTDQFDLVGYSSMFLVQNVGSLFLLINIQLISYALLWLVRKLNPFRHIRPVQRIINYFADKTLWSGAIDFFAQNYLVLTVASLIQSQDFQFGSQYNKTQIMCSVLSILGIIFSIGFPTLVFSLYSANLKDLSSIYKQRSSILQRRNHNQDFKISQAQYEGGSIDSSFSEDPLPVLKKQELLRILNEDLKKIDFNIARFIASKKHEQFKQTYGVLIEGLQLKTNGPILTILAPITNFLLKFMIAIGVTTLYNKPTFTIFMFNFGVLFYLQFTLYVQPYKDGIEAKRQVINSISYLVLNYHLFALTDYADRSVYPLVATSVIFLVLTNIAINLLLILYSSSKVVSWKLKLIWKRRKNRKLQKQIVQKQMTQQPVDNLNEVIQEVLVDAKDPPFETPSLSSEQEDQTELQIEDQSGQNENKPQLINQCEIIPIKSPLKSRNETPRDAQQVAKPVKSTILNQLAPIVQQVSQLQNEVDQRSFQLVQVKTKPNQFLNKVTRVQNVPSQQQQTDLSLPKTNKKTTPAKKATMESHDGLSYQDRLQLEYQKAIDEQRELNSNLDKDKFAELAMRRFYSSLPKWRDFMDKNEKDLRCKERQFLKRHPNQENFLNQVGYERAIFWEKAFNNARLLHQKQIKALARKVFPGQRT